MINKEIMVYFHNHKDGRGIPSIANDDWRILIKNYEKQDIKDTLAEYIYKNSIPFPSKQITLGEMTQNFNRFCLDKMSDQYSYPDNVIEKVDYKYKYKDKPLGVINKSHAYNNVSNYFQQQNRMKCGSNTSDSPFDIWHNKDKLINMNWHFWRLGALGKSNICESTFRSAFRIGTYTATQFRPSVAKILYQKYNANNVLDTSCGWGDRLAGFYATNNTKLYVGCDPNPDVYKTYKMQCLQYENILGCKTPVINESKTHFTCIGTKKVTIYNLASEDVDWEKHKNQFDFYFTSPPYYETERYSQGDCSNQSWQRYPLFNDWKHNFFFRVNRMIWDTLSDKAYMMINIIDPRVSNQKRLKLCDDMVDDILKYRQSNYLGKIGMRMQSRPHSIIHSEKNSIFVEPIWVFGKNRTE